MILVKIILALAVLLVFTWAMMTLAYIASQLEE